MQQMQQQQQQIQQQQQQIEQQQQQMQQQQQLMERQQQRPHQDTVNMIAANDPAPPMDPSQAAAPEVAGSFNEDNNKPQAVLDKTSMTGDMATAAAFAGLRGAFKHPHRDKMLTGSTLRRAQKSLAGNGFDHTNGQYGVPTAMGTSGLGGGHLGIFKPDYGPFGLGPTRGAQFNLGTQPMGSQFQNPVQQGLEANREAINDIATMPQAMSGMMGMAGMAMMGNPYRNAFGATLNQPLAKDLHMNQDLSSSSSA